MNTLEPKLLKELINADYDSLMGFRVRRILMICSNYDAFILEEDGQIETRIYKEYIDLNLSTPPTFLWAQTSAEAREMLQTTVGIDMIICMYNTGDNDFNNLNLYYNGGKTNTGAGLLAAPLYFVRSGYVNNTSIGNFGSSGYYWSSTVNSTTNAYFLYFNSGNVNPANSTNRNYGFSVRCIAR